MFFQQTKENQIKFLKKYLLMERLSFFTDNYLEKQNYRLMLETIKNASDLRKIKNLTNGLAEQNVQLESTETAMLNLLEDSQELEERMSAIVSSMGEGLIVIDSDLKIILINSTAEKLLEISLEKAVGRKIIEIVSLLKGQEKVIVENLPVVKTLKTGEIVNIDLVDNYYYQLASGKKFPVILTDTPLIGNGITGAVVVFKDATNEKKLDESRSSFISIASHQLRSPLTIVRWYTEMLRDGDIGQLNDEQKKFLSQIYDSVLKLNDTINTLLFLARVESKQIKIAPSKFNILQFTQAVIDGFKLLTEEKKLNLTVDANVESKDLDIFINQSFLDQVVANLLSNAIRYTKEKGNIRIKIERRDKEIAYSVQDDGIGIPENQKNRIFEKFFRAENAKEKVADGNGLGLVLAKNLVELWGGKIWFESEENKGTKFYFTIPI
ncbi:PAS domain-containing protein [Candidatus Wolfebacteria bacterium]|nr:PAS domain-containing protein [Candidatus Wolfebacteria bacterium]